MKKFKSETAIFVEIAKNKNDLKYLITVNGLPIPDACLWLDLMSINSYLTGERYAYALLKYFRFLENNNMNYLEVTNKKVIEEYIKELLGLGDKIINYESKITYSALKTNISVVKSFYLWLEDEQKTLHNPLLFVSKKMLNSKNTKSKLLYGQIWSFEVQETILSRVTYKKKLNHLKWYTDKEINDIKNELISLRDKTIFTISVETGMRIGEILGMKLNHFNPNELILEVVKERNIENKARAKTMERTVHIHKSLSEMIQSYIQIERTDSDILGSNFLFLNQNGTHKGKPLKTRNFLRILKDAGQRAGLKKQEIRTHSGRSTRAQELIEIMRDKPDIGVTQAFIDEELGWKNGNSIKVYERGYSKLQKRKILERIKPISLNNNLGENDNGNN